MNNLLDILTENTQDLKSLYFDKTINYCKSYYDTCKIRSKWFEVEWCKYFDIQPEIKNINTSSQFLGYPKGFHNTQNAKRLHNLRNDIRRVLSKTLEEYIAIELNNAQIHYDNSIKKLATRIINKGLNLNNIEVTNSSIGININITISDSIKTINAYTIVAEGEIQQPHYRYLIK